MLLPRIFKSEDFKLLKEIIEDNSFSNLIINKDRIISTKAMMLVNGIEKDDFFIETHLNRANPVARNIKKVEQEVLCDFTGAHAYISSSWYDHINVSTWNYEVDKTFQNVPLLPVGKQAVVPIESVPLTDT